MMRVERTPLAGLVVVTPARFSDARGFFSELWNRSALAAAGLQCDFVQENHSLSISAGTVRGLHFQAPPHAQAKLVRCGRGRIFDVAVDLRRGSATFGKWFGIELSFENARQMLVPEGFAHGFVTREPESEIIYACTRFHAPSAERAVAFDDPDIGIDWGLGALAPTLSDRDAAAPRLRDVGSPFVWEGETR